MLICPTCGGHFEAILYPDKAYVCATRRRKPGTCTNTLKLPMQLADDVVLDMIEGEVLGERYFNELLAMVGKAEWDDTARLTADRARLTAEVDSLGRSIANGCPPRQSRPAIRAREAEIARLDTRLRSPQRPAPDLERLREALTPAGG